MLYILYLKNLRNGPSIISNYYVRETESLKMTKPLSSLPKTVEDIKRRPIVFLLHKSKI